MDSRTAVVLYAVIWLGGAVALAGVALTFNRWLWLAAVVWLVLVGWLVATLAVALVL